MLNELIGREKEREILDDALKSKEAEMVSVIGRRRVGKTFLITSSYAEHFEFELTGVQNAPTKLQLRNFRDVLDNYAKPDLPIEIPSDWLAAFSLLRNYLTPLLGKKKRVVFFDELPWLATHRSGFLQAFGYWWNSWASRQNLVVVICGSAASWMIHRVVNDRGGLHNRITKRIQLNPFTLGETERYFQSRKIKFNRYQLMQLYFAFGGVPHYLKEVKKGKSAAQNIDALCFSKTGLLKDEFSNLYPALFKKADNHMNVVRALAKKWQGMTRQEILKATKLPTGGGLTTVLKELEQSGFVMTYFPFGKTKKEVRYRLTDEYSLFYLQFMETRVQEGEDVWKHLSQTQQYKSWSGYAFENVCLKHIPQIKKALSISGVYALASNFYKKGQKGKEGVQIDLLLDRQDHVINLFEIKFYNEVLNISKSFAEKLNKKASIFRNATNTKKQIFWTLITTFGIQENEHSLGLIDSTITLDDLF